MVTTNTHLETGIGLYTPQEAARFTKLRPQTLKRWLFGDARGEAAVHARFESIEESRIVAFSDLIQAVAIRTLRTSEKGRRVTLGHVREVVDECSRLDISYPLARNHTLYWYSNRLILKTESGDFIGVTPEMDKDQLYHNVIIEPFLQEVTFGVDKLAETWNPLVAKDHAVSLSSQRRFGMPTIEPGGILVSALIDAVESEGSIRRAADAFEVDREAVLLALKYNEYLASAA